MMLSDIINEMRAIFIKIIFSLLSLLSYQLLCGQGNDIVFHKNYLVFNKDTFNRIDAVGEIYGKGLVLEFDSLKTTSKIINYNCFWKNGKSYKCKQIISKVDTSYIVNVYTLGTGEYYKSMKQGKWRFSSYKDLKRLDAEVNYKNDTIVGPLLINNTNSKLALKIEKEGDHWSIFKWEDSEKKLKKTGEESNIGLYLEIYNVK